MAEDAALSSQQIMAWLDRCADVFAEHKTRLTDLDSAVGDGDHGNNMARGFAAVRVKLSEWSGKDAGTIFKGVAMTLISTVGGASGPLYGTFFLQAASVCNGKMQLTPAELANAFEAGLKGVMQRGKAVVGDKTMVDALTPAVEALKPAEGESVSTTVSRALAAVQKGADSTIPLTARKGRASYLGERSAGHMDPGAASCVLLIESLMHVVKA